MKLADLRHPRLLLTAAEHRRIRPWYWRNILLPRLKAMSDDGFLRECRWNDDASAAIAGLREHSRFRFFFHPRNRKEFFLGTLTTLQPEIDIITDGERTLRNEFQTLGSPLTALGNSVPWHRDFKSGKEWPLRELTNAELLDLGHPSDVKVPWELSRFHQAWWLGKAYWVTGRETYAEKFGALVSDWIEQNPPGLGVNWSIGMEAAIRAANWIAGFAFFCESRSLDTPFWMRFVRSLHSQGLFIENNLEYARVSGNHYLSDIVGLLFLGMFFQETPFGKRWLGVGSAELEKEMLRQVDADGVDFEKSTSYHRLVLELFLSSALLCRVNNRPLSRAYESRLERMIAFVMHYSRPDGSVPLWGDADDGRLFRMTLDEEINDHRHILSTGAALFGRPDFARAAGTFHQETLWYFGGEGFERFRALRAGTEPGSNAFPEGGVYVMRDERIHVFIDAGELGQRGRGGHGHNDTLSFTYWRNGRSIIVDPGTYAYTFDTEARQEFRSTRSHNTVMVDAAELADFDGLWQVRADTTSPRVLAWRTGTEADELEAEHSAYCRLPEPVVVRRLLRLEKPSGRVVIRDCCDGSGVHRLESFLHFAPDVQPAVESERRAVATVGTERYIITASTGSWSIRETWYSPSYGVRERSRALVLTQHVPLPADWEVRIEPQ